MTKSNELAPTAPTSSELAPKVPEDKVLLRRYFQTIAKSPTHILSGEAAMIDKRGVAMGRRAVTRRVLAYQALLIGAVFGGGALVLGGAWAPGVLLYLTGAMPTFIAKYRGTGALMAIDVIARQGNLEEAQRRLDAAHRARRNSPAMYARIAGTLASHRGEYATALTWWRKAMPKAKGIGREILKASIAQALARNGELAEARLMAETIAFPPEADFVLTGQILTPVLLALHAEDRAALPEVEQLHDWTRMALAYSHTGVDLAALGWAFERRDEPEMADFLAREARERMHYKYLATWWPQLQAWLDGHAASANDMTAE